MSDSYLTGLDAEDIPLQKVNVPPHIDDADDDEKKEIPLPPPPQPLPLPPPPSISQGINFVSNLQEHSGTDGRLAQFFTHQTEYICNPNMSFKWPKSFGLLKVTQPNVTDLVRSTCKKLMEHSKYVDVNYSILADYIKTIDCEAIDDYATNINMFQLAMEDIELSERDVINMSCLFVILQFGSGFRSIIHKFCAGRGVSTIALGIRNMYKKYSALDVHHLYGITIDDISKLFEIDIEQSLPLKSLCDMIRKTIQGTVHILQLKQLNDFADYVYHYIDLAWIKSQTSDLSAIKTIEWKLNKRREIGLTLAPTQSTLVRRSVVVGYEESNDDTDNLQNNKVCKDLVDRGGFLYAINDQVIYNKPFPDVIATISSYLNATDANAWNPLEYTVGGTRMVALQFGLHLDREPKNMQTLLFNFINDFSVLNNQYLYRSLFSPKKNLRVYLFQSVQSIIMELYYNVYVKAHSKNRNPIFNFKGISTLTAVVDNVIPFIFLRDEVIKIKDEYKEEFDEYIAQNYVLHTSDLEVEIIAASVCAIDAIIASSKLNVNVAKLTYYLRNLGKLPKYSSYAKFHTRSTSSNLKIKHN